MNNYLSWLEISKKNIKHNLKELKKRSKSVIAPCIKANAYGHGLTQMLEVFLESGVSFFCVNSYQEAIEINEFCQKKSLQLPQVLIIGYVPLTIIPKITSNSNFHFCIYNDESVKAFASQSNQVKLHLKIETGLNRQGISGKELKELVKKIQNFKNLEIVGAYSHFANVEDTTDRSYAKTQLQNFNNQLESLKKIGVNPIYKHLANSAALMTFSKAHFNFVRIGIASYGLWPSKETLISDLKTNKVSLNLRPVLTWKAKIAQVKTLKSGEYVGYGCTYKTTQTTKIAVIPVGYFDGYVRSTKNAHIIVKGERAPVIGRIAMNMFMVDVSACGKVKVEDTVTLLGTEGGEKVSAEDLANWTDTINYEVTTRIGSHLPRILI